MNTPSSVSRRTGTVLPARKASTDWKARLQAVPRWAWGTLCGGVLLLGVAGTMLHREAVRTAPVALFSYDLTAGQVRECADTLARWHVEHSANTDKNNILVAPDQRVELLNRLTREDIPHRDFSQGVQGVSTLTPTRAQQLAHDKGQLEESIGHALREMRGVQGADVRLAIPETTFGDEVHPSASVMLTLVDGYQLPRQQAQGIARFVAGAVTCMRPEDVTVVDQKGREVTCPENQTESWQLEVQKQMENHLASKAQALLDRAYGVGRATCALNVEFDFSQMEAKRTDTENSLQVLQKTTEEYHNSGKPTAGLSEDEEAHPLGESQPDKNYVKICEARKLKPDEAFTWTVYKLPRIQKMTCSVLIDSKSQSENAASLVRGAIGLNAERGDELSVCVVPMPMEKTDLVPGFETDRNRQPAPAPWPVLIGLLGAAGACLAVAVGILGMRRVRHSEIVRARAEAAGPREVCDVTYAKDGTSTGAVPTATRKLTSQLEEMARNQPQMVASWLSTTYLKEN